jgi:hypothetical protein
MGSFLGIFGLVLVLQAQDPLSIGVTKGLGFSLRDKRGETMARVQIGEISLKPRPIRFVKVFGRSELVVRDVVIEVREERRVPNAVRNLKRYSDDSLKNIKCFNFRLVDCVTKKPMLVADEAWIRDGQIYIQGNCVLNAKNGRQVFESAVVKVSGDELIYTIKNK